MDEQLPKLRALLEQRTAVEGRQPQEPPELAHVPEYETKKISILEQAGRSDQGKVRENDEDSFVISSPGANQISLAEESMTGQVNVKGVVHSNLELMHQNGVEHLSLVADGMGGHGSGEVISQLVATTVVHALSKTEWNGLNPKQIEAAIASAIREAQESVQTYMTNNNIFDGGSTLTLAMIIAGKLYTANIGDSRVLMYEVSTNSLKKLTTDHSWVEKAIAHGLITEDERKTHNQRNVITSVIDNKPIRALDVKGTRLVPQNGILITCCDGLWELLSDYEITDILSKRETLEWMTQKLIDKANEHGGSDNITVTLSRIAAS